MFHDVSERKILEREVVEIDADERHRIGQELHDTIAQEILGVSMLTHALAEDLKDQALPQAETAFTIFQHMKRIQEQVRALSHSIVPGEIEATELKAALVQLETRVRGVHKRECVFNCPDTISVENNVVATHLYRIAQEAIANSLKHSEAKRIDIGLFRDASQLVLQIRDDGIGMRDKAAAAKGIGLRIMHH
jgi:two-component system CheB/CheR fusion protein